MNKSWVDLALITRPAGYIKLKAVSVLAICNRPCTPSSCYAAFNQFSGEKEMLTRPLMGHAAPQDIQGAFFERVLRHVGK